MKKDCLFLEGKFSLKNVFDNNSKISTENNSLSVFQIQFKIQKFCCKNDYTLILQKKNIYCLGLSSAQLWTMEEIHPSFN